MQKSEVSKQNKKALEYHQVISQKLQTLCTDLFTTFGFNHFCYNRFLPNSNHFAMFMTNHGFTERSIELKIDQYFTSDLIITENNALQSIVWDMNSTNPLYDWLLENNYAHGISFLIKREDNELEGWHFATDSSNSRINQVYLYHLDMLKKFVLYLQSHLQEVIFADPSFLFHYHDDRTFQHENSFELPFAKEVEEFKNSILQSNYMFQIANVSISLTPNQFTLLEKYVQGYSSKEIAQQMNISPRTVENSLEGIKTKLFCHTRTNLRKIYKDSIYASKL